ncbi:MAG: diaminopimelate epimerase [Actinomycetaceae bacterium]|nr:diaminopimelate epimerase [Arcanobacterium sp.]MDD7505103.1 diaminopimelate epimerase [Actinomycetaceae bacterium]
MEFTKIHGIGNDFIVFDGISSPFDLTPRQVRILCDRNFGVGADGVIIVQPPRNPGSAGYMHYFNADGSLAQMCGNGIRCTAKWLVDGGYVTPDAPSAADEPATGALTIDTLSGPKHITYRASNGKLTDATVNMGAPILNPADIPVNAETNATANAGTALDREKYATGVTVNTPWAEAEFTFVSMGNPHAVWFIENFLELPGELFIGSEHSLDQMDIDRIGAFLSSHRMFPDRANIEFAALDEDRPDIIHMRVFERGVGETLACGTGACATAVAAALTDQTTRNTEIHLPGGTLDIQWKDDGDVYMTGAAAQSFVGEVSI